MLEAKTVSTVKEGVRTAALYRLFGPGFQLPEILPAPTQLDDLDETWMAKIIISSEQLRIQFKVYYTVPLAKDLYCLKFPNAKELPARIYHDFMREFCNLTAGAIKLWLADLASMKKNEDLVVNLPIQKPASAELPKLGASDRDDILYDSCLFKSAQSGLLCVSEIQILDWQKVGTLAAHMPQQDNSDSDLEFL